MARDGEALILAAANDGGASHPGWFFNLVAHPAARVEGMGRTLAAHTYELPYDEGAASWQRILRRVPGYERYSRATCRTVPIMRLVPVSRSVWVGPVTGRRGGPASGSRDYVRITLANETLTKALTGR